jgi:hypothetical protein
MWNSHRLDDPVLDDLVPDFHRREKVAIPVAGTLLQAGPTGFFRGYGNTCVARLAGGTCGRRSLCKPCSGQGGRGSHGAGQELAPSQKRTYQFHTRLLSSFIIVNGRSIARLGFTHFGTRGKQHHLLMPALSPSRCLAGSAESVCLLIVAWIYIFQACLILLCNHNLWETMTNCAKKLIFHANSFILKRQGDCALIIHWIKL